MAWTDATLNNTNKIRTIHIDELRNAIETLEEVSCPAHNSTYNTTVNRSYYSSTKSSVDSHNSANTIVGSYHGAYGYKAPCFVLLRRQKYESFILIIT